MKRWRFVSISVLLSFFFIVFSTITAFADTAEVLPKGVFRSAVLGKFYFPVDEKFKDNGETADPAYKYNANVNSTVFPDLSLIEAGFGLPAGSASLGTTVVSFEYDFQLYELYFAYGITDRLSAGIMIPYWFVKNNVDARLDTTTATVGANPNPGGPPFGATPFVPIALGGVPLTSADIQRLLATNYGYKPVKTWENDGLSDIELGLKYLYYQSNNWRLASTVGLRLPTGETDDPDSLVDYPLGSGAWAILFALQNDYIGIKNLVLNATFKYDLYIPDHEVMRIPDDVRYPLTANKEEVSRDRGDVITMELSAQYEFYKGFTIGALYKLGYGFQDHVDGNRGYIYQSVEEETDYREQVFIVGLGFNTLAFYREKTFPVPLTFGVSYRNRFEGMNTLKSQYIEAAIGIYF